MNNDIQTQVNKAKKIVKEAFDPIIGQTVAKQKLTEIILGSILEKGFLPPILITAPVGTGKSKFLKAIKNIVKNALNRKTVYFETGREMGTPLTLMEDYLIPHFNDKDAVLFADEIHQATGAVHDFILGMVDRSTARESKVVKRGDYEILVNPHRNSFIFATNEIDKLNPAILSRFEAIELVAYTDREMEQILFQGLDGNNIHFHEDTLRAIAECNRGSARDIVTWVDAVRRHLSVAGKNTINKQDVAEIVRKKETFPLGVTKHELNTLLFLEKYGEQQLRELAAKNRCASAEQQKTEIYLLSRNLMTVESKRKITQDGRNYLKGLREEGFISH